MSLVFLSASPGCVLVACVSLDESRQPVQSATYELSLQVPQVHLDAEIVGTNPMA
jgi:hypothetical protein